LAGFASNKRNPRKINNRNLSESKALEAAIRAHRVGDIKNAESLYKLAIARGCNHPAVFSNLGVIYKNTRRSEEAISCFDKSLNIDPLFADAYANQGSLLKELGRLDQALVPTLKAIELKPDNVAAHMNLSGILKEQGKLDQAIVAILKVIALEPDNSYAHANLGIILKEQGQLDQSLAATFKAIELNLENVAAYMNLGCIFQGQGKPDQALQAHLKAIELMPENSYAHSNLGSILHQIGNLEQARETNLKAIELKPDNSYAHLNLGIIFHYYRQFDQALAATLMAVELKPEDADAQVHLGCIYNALGQLDRAHDAFQKAIQLGIPSEESITAVLGYYEKTNQLKLLAKAIGEIENVSNRLSIATTIFRARLQFRLRNYKSSLDTIRQVNSESARNSGRGTWLSYCSFRAFIEEKAGDYDAAYNAFCQAQNDDKYKHYDSNIEYRRLSLYQGLSQKLSSPDKNQFTENCKWVFLIGFPRSGTTLLDTILRSHPDIEVAEEKQSLESIEKIITTTMGKSIDCFHQLTPKEIFALRDNYLASMSQHCDITKKIVIDKLPLHTITIPLINLLFPSAKIIFAVRHPCDTVLSCFQQTFEPNNSMAALRTIKSASVFYDSVMSAWHTYNQHLHIDYCLYKYEDLIEDFQPTIQLVLDHLGLSWDQNIMRYQQTALDRGSIKTPSSSQVVQPIYRTSMNKWLHYKGHFSESMYLLNKWITHWGYESV